jgi:serine/threonine-protein kinase
MPVRVKCPRCQKALSFSDESPGPVACPECKASLRLSVSGAPAGAPAVRPPAPPKEPKESIPAVIGPYQIRGKLGEGAFGVVYRGFDPTLDREVALKLLRPERFAPGASRGADKVVQRFLREAKVVAQLLHGNIVPVFQLGEHEGAPFIASAFIPGRSLADVVAEHESGLDPARAVRFTVQLLDALAHAHDRGVLHRDVKPSNAMVDKEDRLYLMDFGLAGWDKAGEGRMTQDGTVMGTPAYMPPEQAGGKIELVGKASDQYSAGVVLYELLTGHLPFEGANNLAMQLGQILHAAPTPPREWVPGIDPALEALCLQALAKSPDERFPGCKEFADRLRAWSSSPHDAGAARPAGRQPGAARVAAPQRSTISATAARQTAVAEPSAEAVAPAGEAPEEGGGLSRRTWLFLLAGGGAVTILGAGGYVVVKTLSGGDKKKASPTKEKEGFFEELNK